METVTLPKTRTRVIVKRGSEYLLLRVEDVVLFLAFGRLVFVFDRNGNKYLIDQNLRSILEGLEPNTFFRANRKCIININYIKSYKTFENVKIKIELTVSNITDGLVVSQERARVFKEWISNI